MSSTFFGALTLGAKFGGAKFQKDKQQFKQLGKCTLSFLMQFPLSNSLYSQHNSIPNATPSYTN